MDNKEKILHNALMLFSARGYDAVGVQEICEISTITKPTLYHYYNSKHGVLEALLNSFYPPFLEEVRHGAEYHRDLVLNLEQLANAFFHFASDHPDFNRFALTVAFSPRENEAHIAQKKYAAETYKIIEELFRRAVPEHGNLKNKEKQLSASFIGLLNSYVGLFLSGTTVLDKSVARSLVKQYMHGIFS
jgi:TetR/AcrR family transcriptional regulator